MKVGIDGRALQVRRSGEPWSGVGQYTYHLLHALFALDKENEYVIWYNGMGKIVAPDFSQYPNIRVHRTHWPNKLLNIVFLLFRNSTFYVLRSTFDVFFMSNLNFIALPASVKLVTVVHDLSFEHFPEFFSRKSRLWHRAINPRALLNRADKVVAVSEHTRNDVIETYGIASEKVSVVYPGANCPEDLRIRRFEINESSNHPIIQSSYILYLGALEPRKNIMGVIEAYEKLKSRESLVLAGLSTTYVKQLKKRIAQSKLREKISLVENPTEDEKTKLYVGAHVFVYPSYYEGFGFPPLEAMAAGVPVVASSASSVPEICGDAALLVSPWKIEEIKEGMKMLLEDDTMRRVYIEAGYMRIKEFFWRQCAKQIWEIFQNVGRT